MSSAISPQTLFTLQQCSDARAQQESTGHSSSDGLSTVPSSNRQPSQQSRQSRQTDGKLPSSPPTSDEDQPETPPNCCSDYVNNVYMIIHSPTGDQLLARIPPKQDPEGIGGKWTSAAKAACVTSEELKCLKSRSSRNVNFYDETMDLLEDYSAPSPPMMDTPTTPYDPMVEALYALLLSRPDLASLIAMQSVEAEPFVPNNLSVSYPHPQSTTTYPAAACNYDMISHGDSEEYVSPWISCALEDRCDHMAYWKRLRARKGFAHYGCLLCRKKWRQRSTDELTLPTLQPGAAELAMLYDYGLSN
eukprot:NODE_1278_length_1799_cov_164.918854_g1213_i0.p1 GENE.NODE_1278_length_1799_cov_164.918854_g1213_i0~~NODE_1278_length_1799_cov_164.918854_g1213_i0.p1  ORF type:complete len:322 (+),score=52.94 NODE_1278_length_1799_cov_164.918854_g1213_i0:55-966(+)